jgi:hypothetical protein
MGLDQNPMLFPAPPCPTLAEGLLAQYRAGEAKVWPRAEPRFFCLSYLSSGCPKIGSKWGFNYQCLVLVGFQLSKILGYDWQLMMIDDWWSKRVFYTILDCGLWTHSSWESRSELTSRRTEDFEHYSSAGIPFVIYTQVQLAGAFPTSTTTRIWMHVSLLQLILCLKVKVRFSGPAIGQRFTGKLNYILEWIRM